ncbi:MAG: PIN domain-containing protein [Rhodocyclaceae bacterium]
MIGLDTNVLIRILVDDGSPQVAQARQYVSAAAAAGHDFFIDTVVLAETVWVLDSVFGYRRHDIATVIDALLGNAAYLLADREAVMAALAHYRASSADFSDCLIVARCRASGCAGTATLDKAMECLPDVVLIR